MRQRRRLRLHAMGVGRDDRLLVLRRERQQLLPGGAQAVEDVEQPLAQLHAGARRAEILAAAPGMEARGVGTGRGDEVFFEDQIVARTLAARLVALRDHLHDPLGDLRGERRRHDPGLVQHHDRRLVHHPEEIERVMPRCGRRARLPPRRLLRDQRHGGNHERGDHHATENSLHRYLSWLVCPGDASLRLNATRPSRWLAP